MRDGVFLDTSFLITLVNPSEVRHKVAKLYFQHFLKARMPMAISAIVLSEFCVKQKLQTLALEQFMLLPFNHEDAVVVAGLDFKAYLSAEVQRQVLKDDFKIIGHAEARGFGYLITDDSNTMWRYCEELRQMGRLHIRPIKLQDGFSLEPFSPDRQTGLSNLIEEEVAQYGPDDVS